MLATRAPAASTNPRNSPLRPRYISCPAVGVKSHGAPPNKPGSANSTPDCSFPAIGWPARKRRPTFLPKTAVAHARTFSLVLPASVSSVLGGSTGPEAGDQLNDRSYGSCQQYDLAAARCIRWVGVSIINGPFLSCALQYSCAVATDDPALKAVLLQGKPKGATDQSGADDGDLTDRHLNSAGAVMRVGTPP